MGWDSTWVGPNFRLPGLISSGWAIFRNLGGGIIGQGRRRNCTKNRLRSAADPHSTWMRAQSVFSPSGWWGGARTRTGRCLTSYLDLRMGDRCRHLPGRPHLYCCVVGTARARCPHSWGCGQRAFLVDRCRVHIWTSANRLVRDLFHVSSASCGAPETKSGQSQGNC